MIKNKSGSLFVVRRVKRVLLTISGAIALGLLFLVVAAAALPAGSVHADGPDKAHIVIQFDANNAIVRPISFTAPISGLAALEMSGLELVTTTLGFGPVVCAIEQVGDSATNCFGTGFWAYSFWNGSQWEAYAVGANSSVVNDGAIELWSWSPGFVQPPAPGSGPQFVAAANGLGWLAGQQSDTNGSYNNSIGPSVETAMTIGANRNEASAWRRRNDSPSLLGYIQGLGSGFANGSVSGAAKLAVALAAAEGCWPPAAKTPLDYYDAVTGAYNQGSGPFGPGPQAWAIIGTVALSQPAPANAVQYLINAAKSDGGWEWQDGFGTDTNSTALALQALLAAGQSPTSTAVTGGLSFLEAAQNADGGFPYDPKSPFDTSSDTNSSSYSVQAIVAAGQDPLTGTWVMTSATPISFLQQRQLSDGSFEWQQGGGTNLLATQQAIAALLQRPFPVKSAVVPPCNGNWLPFIVKQ